MVTTPIEDNSTKLKVGVRNPTWRARVLSKSFIRRVIIGVTPFRELILYI